ncbi:MAG: RluA family pseudouridine synthase [Gammaproteobacteria bacterium]|nr:RluA family pseudouridine synthase [Gammaproteobacteria bacterium]
MSYLTYIPRSTPLPELPKKFTDPFANKPDYMSRLAAKHLKQRLKQDEYPSNLNKMFGVLVVKLQSGELAYVSGFSGMLFDRWEVDGFVPPVFNVEDRNAFLSKGELQLQELSLEIERKLKSTDRLQCLSRIETLETDWDKRLSEIKQSNKKNKIIRKQKREFLQQSEEAADELKVLAIQSQREKSFYKSQRGQCKQELGVVKRQLREKFEDDIKRLKDRRKSLSAYLQNKVFEGYQLLNINGDTKGLLDLFNGEQPPSGSADCVAPKLLQYAFNNDLKPIAMTEFWWGDSSNNEVRQYGFFYPPCRSKCHHILPFMLEGLPLTNPAISNQLLEPKLVYEDDDLLLVDKPAGLLSIPGKEEKHSVLTWLKEQYPQATGGVLLHRLDQATSGLLLAAKSAEVYKALQKQFLNRSIKKRYVALLSKPIKKSKGAVNLPLRGDLDDRPRQLVCFEYGKEAITHMKLIAIENGLSRVYFYPQTGRTHQLRVHAAHHLGLAAPIVGDDLYGHTEDRLMLHAQKLEFFHPVQKKVLSFESKPPF